jgi:hypothetical protein
MLICKFDKPDLGLIRIKCNLTIHATLISLFKSQIMKNLKLFLALFSILFFFSSCESLEKTDLVRREVITKVENKTLVYELYLTGLDKYRYTFKLVGTQDSTQLFEAHFTDETANYMNIDIEQEKNNIRIILDKPVEHQTKTVDGFTYELASAK